MAENMQSQMNVGAEIIEQVWNRLKPYELPSLRAMPSSRILVIRGSYDHVEKILSNAKIPHVRTDLFPKKDDFGQGGKYSDCRVIFVNCDSSYHDGIEGLNSKGLSGENKSTLVSFVQSGGRIVTTDWA